MINLLIEQVCAQTKEPKSKVIELALSDFLKSKLKKDLKKLSQISFQDLPSEDEWLTIQSN